MISLQIRASIFKITDKISGFNLLPEVRQLVALETLDQDRREEYQLQKLRKLLIHAGITVPYYQKLFRTCNFHPEKLGSLADLQKLPVLDKKQIRESPQDFLSTLYGPHDLTWGQTGGSTGQPMKYALDPVCRVKVRAPLYRALSWAGWKPGDAVVSLWGRPIVKTFPVAIRDRLKSFVTNYHEIDAHVLGRAVLQQYIQLLLDKNPRWIVMMMSRSC
jgi:phenylacetate-CoA ligase